MGVLLPILMYHQVAPESEVGFEPYLHVTPDQLRQQIRALGGLGYRLVTLSEAWTRIESGTGGRCACLTFDDAAEGLLHHALPVLQECGASATAFVIANQIQPAHSVGTESPGFAPSMLRALMEGGVEIGSHSVEHREMHRLSAQDLRREAEDSRARIEDATGAPCSTFCYPRGRVTDRVMQAVAGAGYQCATSTLRGTVQSIGARYRLRRIRMHGDRYGWSLRAALSRPYDLCNILRRWREWRGWAREEAEHLEKTPA